MSSSEQSEAKRRRPDDEDQILPDQGDQSPAFASTTMEIDSDSNHQVAPPATAVPGDASSAVVPAITDFVTNYFGRDRKTDDAAEDDENEGSNPSDYVVYPGSQYSEAVALEALDRVVANPSKETIKALLESFTGLDEILILVLSGRVTGYPACWRLPACLSISRSTTASPLRFETHARQINALLGRMAAQEQATRASANPGEGVSAGVQGPEKSDKGLKKRLQRVEQEMVAEKAKSKALEDKIKAQDLKLKALSGLPQLFARLFNGEIETSQMASEMSRLSLL
ncbi:hypothetical protein QBC47DRAFT_442140 [Echria macrotheca]|uniref:Uncharacterized protein n=1 Tax=Echria macrotheca TaxID=438768 RepID=A0AAJ0F6W1_9PEZI|nr:hypothetical protein QBC47DRAFT_442140 [Echria macrotheca]